MPWTLFVQIVFLFVLAPCLGAHLYSCGRVGASLMAPITNALQRAVENISRRSSDKQSQNDVTPSIRS